MATISVDELKMKVAEMQDALLNAHPRMPVLLQDIHKILKADPENVTLLEEDEIAILVRGLEAQTKTNLATNISKAKTGKSLKSISAADL